MIVSVVHTLHVLFQLLHIGGGGQHLHFLFLGYADLPAVFQNLLQVSPGEFHGAVFIHVDDLAGSHIHAADMDGDPVYKADLTGAVGIVLGSEGEGISRLVKEKCDFVISIPMYGKVNSMNVSCAAAVILSEVARQKNREV